jgi:hypothetical protein
VPSVRPDAIVVGPTYALEVEFTELTRDWWTVIIYDSAGTPTDKFSGTKATDSVFLDSRPPIGVQVDVVQNDLGAADGAIDVTYISGDGPFQFSLNGIPPQTATETACNYNGLSAGAYSLRVQDVYGCNATLPVQIASTSTFPWCISFVSLL